MLRAIAFLLLATVCLVVGNRLDAEVRELMKVRHDRGTIRTLLPVGEGPDPNSYYATYWHGKPFPWEQWGHGWNRAAGSDNHTREHVNRPLVVAAFLTAWSVTPALIVIVIGLFRWICGALNLSRARRYAAALVLGAFGCGIGGLVGAFWLNWCTWAPERTSVYYELYTYVRAQLTRLSAGYGTAKGWAWYRWGTVAGMILGAVGGLLVPRVAIELRSRTTGRPERWLALACFAHTVAVAWVLLSGFRDFSPVVFALVALLGPVLIISGIAVAMLSGVRFRRWAIGGAVAWVCAAAYFQWQVFATTL